MKHFYQITTVLSKWVSENSRSMKNVTFLSSGLILLMSQCTYDSIEGHESTGCVVDSPVNSKEQARSLIIGNWNWVKTTYTRRGTGITTETPNSTTKTLTYKFTDSKVQIFENGNLTEGLYEIQFWGEGTNTVDETLVIRFTTIKGELQGTSLLHLNPSGTCMTLVNSYDDVGGDLTLKRAVSN